ASSRISSRAWIRSRWSNPSNRSVPIARRRRRTTSCASSPAPRGWAQRNRDSDSVSPHRADPCRDGDRHGRAHAQSGWPDELRAGEAQGCSIAGRLTDSRSLRADLDREQAGYGSPGLVLVTLLAEAYVGAQAPVISGAIGHLDFDLQVG